MVSFDRKGAFDNIDWYNITDIIDSSPLPLYLKCLLKNYIANRFIGVNRFEFTQRFQSYKG